MLSIGIIPKGEGAGYYAQYPSKGDALGDEVEGEVFENAAAAALGLPESPTPKQIEMLMQGRWRGADLVQGAGEDRRPGMDLTFSAPKSVSVLHAAAELAGDEAAASAVQQAHADAVQKALSIMQETCAHSRTGKAGKGGLIKGEIVAVSYEHRTSRLGDMQLHTHNMLMNLIYCDDGKWRTLSNEQLLHSKMTLGAAYRAELAQNLKNLGYTIEADGDAFKVAGIDESVTKHFSKRRNEIETLAERYGVTAAKTMDELAQNSKKAKNRDMTMDDLRDSWKVQLAELGFSPDQIVQAAKDAELDQDLIHVIARDALLDKLTSKNSTFREADVMREAYIVCQHMGRGTEYAHKIAAEIVADKEILSLGSGKFTTRKMLEIEVSTLAWAKSAQAQDAFAFDKVITEIAIQKNTLTSEQASAMRALSSGSGIGILEGMAGTGKSRTMLAYREAAEASGFRVLGAALAGKAAAGLQEGAGIESSTIHRLLIDIDSGKVTLTDRDILVIDEAAMSDNALLSRVADAVREAGAKAVLLGDARQIQAIGAGGMFDQLSKEVGASTLTEIWRQKNEEDVSSVHKFADGKAGEALTYYKEQNRLHIESKTDAAMKEMVDAWKKDSTTSTDKIMMASRRCDVDQINIIARNAVTEELGIETRFATKDGVLTIAEGERILFKKNDKNLGLMNGHTGTVEHVGYNVATGEATLSVRLDTGETVTFSESDYDSIRYGYCVTAHASQGDTKQAAYIYASTFMNREMGYVMASRHKETAHIFASDEEFERVKDDRSTAERLAWVMEQSNQKRTALQEMERNGVTLNEVLTDSVENTESPQMQRSAGIRIK